MTRVVFRKFNDGEVIALFPDFKERDGVLSYTHNGQHGNANRIRTTKPATEEEYRPLLLELTKLGYNDLTIRKRINK